MDLGQGHHHRIFYNKSFVHFGFRLMSDMFVLSCLLIYTHVESDFSFKINV